MVLPSAPYINVKKQRNLLSSAGCHGPLLLCFSPDSEPLTCLFLDCPKAYIKLIYRFLPVEKWKLAVYEFKASTLMFSSFKFAVQSLSLYDQ